MKIREYIENNRDRILNDYIKLLKIPSISDTKEAYKALEFVKELYEQNGFDTALYEDYLLTTYKNGQKTIGLFAHADVVSADDKWTVTNPFEPKIVDGELFARGSGDDKSAIIASLYAQKAIKELNIPFKSSIITFTGANEESTMHDIKSYIKSHTPPDFSLVLDAGFPVYYGDKGILWLMVSKETVLYDLISLKGGSTCNIILGEANAKVRYSRELYCELQSNENLTVSADNGEITINAKGISSHGAMPQGSINAGGIILSALLNAESFSKSDKEKLRLLAKLLTTYDGDLLGIKAEDSIFGQTTITNGIIDISKGKISFSLDIRHGNTYTQKELISRLNSVLSKEGFTLEIIKDGEAHYTDVNNKYIKACINAYREHTGNTSATPRINAGSTYQRYIPSSCEIGTTTKYNSCGLPQGHGSAHQPNEHINIDGFFDALEILIKMLIECDKLN